MTLLNQKYDAGWLIIMAKVPGAGRVKTRLAREAGSTAATFFYRQTCRAVIARLSTSHRWNVVLSIAPDSGVHDRFWPSGISKLGQGDGDIGRRMQRAIAAMPPGPDKDHASEVLERHTDVKSTEYFLTTPVKPKRR